MSNVFANGREISAKKDNNKSICAMPDVCLSPPSPPAGPIPIPYPNTATSDDTDGGSKTVQIGGSEVGLKNVSTYKSSKGDEAATRGLGMGVVTHTIQGKMKHAAWSMDVKIEGQNAIRHMDLTTHNHINNPNIAVVLNQASQNIAVSPALDCKALEQKTAEQVNKKDGDLRPSAHKKANGMTATTASYKPRRGKAGTFMKAASSQSRVKSGKRGGYAKSRKGNQKMACTKKSWGGCQNANHTEPKLLEQVFDAARKANVPMPGAAGSLGTLTMNINWKPTGETKVKNNPCPNCKKGICAAIDCGLKVVICKDGAPTNPKCP
jgi:Domain of unknown function (DUF4150)